MALEQRDFSVVSAQDFLTDGEPKAAMLEGSAGREEGIEDRVAVLGWHPWTGVGDSQLDDVSVRASGDFDPAWPGHRLTTVNHEIHEYLPELARTAKKSGKGRQPSGHPNGLSLQHGTKKRERGGDLRGDIGGHRAG